MYGLVNKAIKQMVETGFGLDVWKKIKAKAEVLDDRFLSMESYPDDLTHRLVVAASQELEMPADQILKAFGEYWVKYTAQEGYGELMSVAGSDFREFMENLDDLHSRVGVNFPKLVPPSFECEEQLEEKHFKLHYHSKRSGLAPMVVGLVHGLGDRFDTDVDISLEQEKLKGCDHDVFDVKYNERNT